MLQNGEFPEAPELPAYGQSINLNQVMASGAELFVGVAVDSRAGQGLRALEAVGEVLLRPTQLTLLPDGTSIGIQLPGADDSSKTSSYVRATHVGKPWQQLCSERFRVQYTAAEALLPAIQALELVDGRKSQPPELVQASQQSKRHMAQRVKAQLLHMYRSRRRRPPVSRWGFSAELGMTWAGNGLLLLVGWFGLLLLALVALPRSCELRGLSEDEAWSRARVVMALGLLNTFVILDLLKIVVLVATAAR